MSPAHALLTDQFLAWVAAQPRRYPDAMAAWRSSCPRLAIWEDALADRLIELVPAAGAPRIALTAAGQARLRGG